MNLTIGDFNLLFVFLNKIPYYTTLQGANAASLGIKAMKTKKLDVKSIQSYFE